MSSAGAALSRRLFEQMDARMRRANTPRGRIQAIIDTGFDLTNPTILSHLWVNTKENSTTAGDNDLNGFPNDVYGWNFVTGTNNVSDSSATATARVDRPTGPPPNRLTRASSTARSRRSRPSSSTS